MHFTSEPGLHFAFEPKWVRDALRNCLTESWIKYRRYASKLIAIFIVSRGEASCHLWRHQRRSLIICEPAWTRSSEWEGIVVRLGVQRCNAVTIILITMIFSGQQNTNKMIINTQTAVRDKNGFKNVLWQSTNHSNDHKRKKKCFEPLEFWISINIFFLFQMTGGLTQDSK